MSIKSAKAFIARMRTDEEFAEKVEEFVDLESRITFVEAAGYHFTAAEITDEIQNNVNQFSVDELHVVARWINKQ